MNLVKSLALAALCAAVVGCSESSSTTAPTDSNSPISAFSGTWTSTGSTNNVCTSTRYTVTPTSATTANVTYAATCAGLPVSATGTGTTNGTTLNWTAAGSAVGCAFTLNGTAVPGTGTNLNVTYTGNVCGNPVSGSDVLRR